MTKRKAELVEIAQALDISDAEGKITDLIKNIQAHLDSNEATLSKTSLFRGLYGRRHRWVYSDIAVGRAQHRRHPADSDSGTPMSDMVVASGARGRKSMSKAVDKLVDAANIPLPESPIKM